MFPPSFPRFDIDDGGLVEDNLHPVGNVLLPVPRLLQLLETRALGEGNSLRRLLNKVVSRHISANNRSVHIGWNLHEKDIELTLILSLFSLDKKHHRLLNWYSKHKNKKRGNKLPMFVSNEAQLNDLQSEE